MQKDFLKKKFTATSIGSLPFTDHNQACQFIKETFKEDIIFWPQLVKNSFLENMYAQFSEGLPSVKIDSEKKKIYIDTLAKDYQRKLEEGIEHYVNDDLDYFAISEDFAPGLYKIAQDPSLAEADILKGQITGPISFGLTVKQENDRSIIYNQELYQLLVKAIVMKARWQIKKLKEGNDKRNVIIFIDEPYLVSIGSSFVSLNKEDIVRALEEVIDAIHQEGAFAGIHCCGNTDWSILSKTKIDILNFDAFGYLDNLFIYQDDVNAFLKKGSILAWGIVPTSEEAGDENIESRLAAKIESTIRDKKLFDNRFIITPACGCGTLSAESAERVHRLAVEITQRLNNA